MAKTSSAHSSANLKNGNGKTTKVSPKKKLIAKKAVKKQASPSKKVVKNGNKAVVKKVAGKQSKEEKKQAGPSQMWDYFEFDAKYKKL